MKWYRTADGKTKTDAIPTEDGTFGLTLMDGENETTHKKHMETPKGPDTIHVFRCFYHIGKLGNVFYFHPFPGGINLLVQYMGLVFCGSFCLPHKP